MSAPPVPGRVALEHESAPDWYKLALQDYGMRELLPDGTLNPKVRKLFADYTKFPTDLVNKTTPWCAAQMCAWLERSGWESPHSAAASSFLNYGVPSGWVRGAICVIPRIGGSGFHVTMFAGTVDSSLFIGYGANQRDACLPAFYQMVKVVAKRWPDKRLKPK